MTIIEIKKLTKTFGKIQAVCGIDLNIEKGEIFGLLGREDHNHRDALYYYPADFRQRHIGGF